MGHRNGMPRKHCLASVSVYRPHGAIEIVLLLLLLLLLVLTHSPFGAALIHIDQL